MVACHSGSVTFLRALQWAHRSKQKRRDSRRDTAVSHCLFRDDRAVASVLFISVGETEQLQFVYLGETEQLHSTYCAANCR